MDDQRMFETRLADVLRRYVSDGPVEIDAGALARSIAAEAPRRRGWAAPLRTWHLPRTSMSPLGVVALVLLVLLVGIGVAVGSYLLLRQQSVSRADPRGSFEPTGSSAIGRVQAAATTLADGRVLIAGGYPSVRAAELWDPKTGAFTPAGDLATGRWGHTSTLLNDGRVLVAGGAGINSGGSTSMSFSAEVWDPATMTFTTSGSSSGGHLRSMARLLADGRVLISGGTLLTAGTSAGPEVWDPATGTFSSGQDVPDAGAPAGIPLDASRVLWLDGSTAMLWDAESGTSHEIAVLLEPHGAGTSLNLLADGRVLVAGGTPPGGGERLTSAEILDPARDTVEATGSLGQGRSDHVTALLPDGRVLVVGGDAADGRSAELFEPP